MNELRRALIALHNYLIWQAGLLDARSMGFADYVDSIEVDRHLRLLITGHVYMQR